MTVMTKMKTNSSHTVLKTMILLVFSNRLKNVRDIACKTKNLLCIFFFSISQKKVIMGSQFFHFWWKSIICSLHVYILNILLNVKKAIKTNYELTLQNLFGI